MREQNKTNVEGGSRGYGRKVVEERQGGSRGEAGRK
jgi:hypothetical protein